MPLALPFWLLDASCTSMVQTGERERKVEAGGHGDRESYKVKVMEKMCECVRA